MKNLFGIESSILIKETKIIINGPYKLKLLNSNDFTLRTTFFTLFISGEALLIERLSEEYAVFSFQEISHLHVEKIEKESF